MLLPWSEDEYTPLLPTDLDGSPPTPEERIRVAAAVATKMRDFNILRGDSVRVGLNNETVRLVLTMPDEEWKKNATLLRDLLGNRGYDTVSGEKRFEQIRLARQKKESS